MGGVMTKFSSVVEKGRVGRKDEGGGMKDEKGGSDSAPILSESLHPSSLQQKTPSCDGVCSCPGQDLNLHDVTRCHLKAVRLPIPPPGRGRGRIIRVYRGAVEGLGRGARRGGAD